MSDTQQSIDTAKLMANIRERLREEALTPGPIAVSDEDIRALQEETEIDFRRNITTHRKFVGWAYVRFRRWVYREIRMAIDPIVARQTAVNRRLARIVFEQSHEIERLKRRLDDLAE